MTTMKFKVVMEPKIEPHDPMLYRADNFADGAQGWGKVDMAQIEGYREKGFLLVRGAFAEAEIAGANHELQEMELADNPRCESIYFEGIIRDELARAETPKGRASASPRREELAMGDITEELPDLPPETRARYVRKFMGFVEHHPGLAALADKTELRELATRLLGEPVRLYQDMAMIKPPGGREKPWHQDHAYFNLPLETPVLGVWISLGSATLANGCMHVLAGAHRKGPRTHFMRRDWQICDTDLKEEVQTAIPMEPGDVLLFDSKLPHGTPTNHTDQKRWAVQLHYIPASAIETDEADRLATFGAEGKDVTC